MSGAAQTDYWKDRPIGLTNTMVADRVRSEFLERLVTDDLACIWHKRWLTPAEAKEISARVLHTTHPGNPDETGVRNIGPPIAESLGTGTESRQYFARSEDFHRQLSDEVFTTLANPLERLMKTLNDCWSAGAVRAFLQQDVFSAGVFRWFTEGSSLNPHVDGCLNSPVQNFCSSGRLSACIYLETTSPADGGSLELWDVQLDSNEFESRRNSDFSLSRAAIGPPVLRISPEPGDLIIFCTQRIHAVSTLLRGTRLTASSFIGVRGPMKPLTLFG